MSNQRILRMLSVQASRLFDRARNVVLFSASHCNMHQLLLLKKLRSGDASS